tara:strand:+ start:380 stop:817 length:438 start_codon:yes stop_codon:yes gene_type:complete
MRVSTKVSSGFTLTELAFVLVIIIVFILLLSPFISDIRNRAKLVRCEDNLQKIGMGLRLYAIEHGEKFPTGFEELMQGGYLESERSFDCPGLAHTGTAKEPDYHYVTGYEVSSPSESMLVFDKDENHTGGKHVLYVNSDIKWLAR